MIKTLGAHIKEFKKDSLLTPFLMLLEVIAETLIPLLMASIIDEGVRKGDMAHIYRVGAGMVVLAAFALLPGVLGGKYGARASAGFAKNIRQAMYENIYKMFVKAESMIALNNPIMQFTVYACILLISWIGANMIVGSSMTTGDLTQLLAYCMNILMSLMMLSVVFVVITLSIASAERIAEVLNEKADIVNPENPVMQVGDGYDTYIEQGGTNVSGGQRQRRRVIERK